MSGSSDRIYPVLLSGGSGSRLWPLSRESHPKQLLPLCGTETLLQQAARRLTDPSLFEPLHVIASNEHRFVVAEQLRGIDQQASMILEPVPRNTGPAAAIAALRVFDIDPDGILLLCPADHLIRDCTAFRECIARGLPAAAQGKIVLFGVTPSRPELGYGYIRTAESDPRLGKALPVVEFTEKPDHDRALEFVRSGKHHWNSGIFLASARALLDEFERLAPEVLAACRDALKGVASDIDFLRLEESHFKRARSISFDYAILERTNNCALVRADFDWADLGSWSAIWDAGEKDRDANVVVGEANVEKSSDCYVRSDGPLVVALGVHNLVIVATPDAVLVTSRECDQEVKGVVAELARKGHSAARQTPKVHRPWGFYESVHQGDRFQVKQITVNPGAKLSLQKHYHRAEHWVVVNGTAVVERDKEETLLRENESIFIPLGAIHRLTNPGKVPLNLIEVQSGTYLGEDDIVRFEDDYART
jgi:mannose-1-phosphate guanylyltransferase/mannose-6-phosphate isomerase